MIQAQSYGSAEVQNSNDLEEDGLADQESDDQIVNR